MEILGIIGIVLGLLAIIYFTVKKINPIISAPAATIIVIVFNGMPFFKSLVGSTNSYVSAMAGFLITNFAVFLLGSLLAKYMEKSGATISIANFILKKIGTNKPYSVLLALYIIGALLTYGGVSMFVVIFALIPLSRPLFKRLNLSWNLVTIPIFAGIATFTLSMLPGTPASSNFIPSNSLGTPLTAAPIIGIVTTVVVIIYTLIYMKYALNKSIKKGESYETLGADTDENQTVRTENLPNVLISVIPIFALILTIVIFASTANIVLIALSLAILLAAILFRKNTGNQIAVLNEGANGAVGTTFATACTVAFGTLLTSATGFLFIQDSILNSAGTPLIQLALSTMLLSLVTGSSVGTVGIVMNTFKDKFLELGLKAGLIHRVSAIAAGTFGVMPHTGLVISYNSVAKLTLKQSYKYQFMTVNVAHMIALVIAVILGSMGIL